MLKNQGSNRYNLNTMLALDIYLASLDKDEYDKIKPFLKTSAVKSHPLMSWDISGTRYWDLLEDGRKAQDLQKLTEFAQAYNWTIPLPTVLALPYQALVLTNANQVISWVNPGFKEMTGYPANFAIGKTPRFLQGENTCMVINERIRNYLKAGRAFTENIVNYRRNKEEYSCQLNVFPVKNRQNEITHFLALECEF